MIVPLSVSCTLAHVSTESSSSFRTMSNRNLEKRPIDEEATSSFNLSHLDLPDPQNLSTHSFDFLDEPDEPTLELVSMSPWTKLLRGTVVKSTNEKGIELFEREYYI